MVANRYSYFLRGLVLFGGAYTWRITAVKALPPPLLSVILLQHLTGGGMAARDVGLVLGRLWKIVFGGSKPSPALIQRPAAAPSLPLGKEVESEWRLPPIPAGYQIFDARIEVAGLAYQRKDVLRYIRTEEEHKLEFKPDPTNAYDKHAIKVVGIVGAKRYHLGFLPADIAKRLAVLGLVDKVIARLERAYAGENDYVSVIVQVLGPKALLKAYRDSVD
jgi:hypothetical protein